MAFYTIDFIATAEGVSPDAPQAAGHTGDHRAVQLRFAVPFEDCRYRLEIVDGCGGYDTTALLDVTDGAVTYDIPSAWTAAGVAAVRLVAVEQDEAGEEIVRFHTAPAYLTFADREDGEPLGQTARPAWQEVLDEAHFFLATVEQKLKNGEFNGEKGDKGDQGEQGIQGEKGDDGYTPQKGVDYYTDAEKQELIAELGARDVDQEPDPSSNNAIANSFVATMYEGFLNRFTDIESGIEGMWNVYYELDVRVGDVEGQVGGVEAALDAILAIQSALIGGAHA